MYTKQEQCPLCTIITVVILNNFQQDSTAIPKLKPIFQFNF